MASASSTLRAIGPSVKTWRPLSAAAIVGVALSEGGVSRTTTCTSSSVSRLS